MAEILDAAAFPPPPRPLFDDDDDFEFGDFTFASPPNSGGSHQEPQAPAPPAADDDWGDFVASPLGSHPDLPSAPSASWEKMRAPLPLSLFGDDDEDEEPAAAPPPPLESNDGAHHRGSSPISSLGSLPASGGIGPADLKDLIANLYGPPPPPSAMAAHDSTGSADPMGAEEDGFEEDGWEFKVASSAPNGDGIEEDYRYCMLVYDLQGLAKSLGNIQDDWLLFTSSNGNLSQIGTQDHVRASHEVFIEKSIKDLNYSASNKETSPNLPEETGQIDAIQCAQSRIESGKGSSDFLNNEMNSSFETDENHSIKFKSKGDTILIDFYHKMREESFLAISCHLRDLKEAQKISILSDQEKTMNIEEEIQEIYREVQNAMVPKSFGMEEQSSRDVCIDELLKSIKEEYFKDFEREYHLSERISLALEDLSTAVELCKHTMSTLHILQLASKEEQYDYIATWYKILLSCAQELQHGAMVWAESCHAEVCNQIIFQGGQYFVALGETYRVALILSLTLQYFKPWVLSHPGKSGEMLTCLDNCTSAWTTGLDIALERVSNIDQAHASIADALLKSIKHISELDVFNLQMFLHNNEIVCKISLVPITLLQDMKVVTWNGDHYFVKVANYWANQVSRNPPQLPCFSFGPEQ